MSLKISLLAIPGMSLALLIVPTSGKLLSQSKRALVIGQLFQAHSAPRMLPFSCKHIRAAIWHKEKKSREGARQRIV